MVQCCIRVFDSIAIENFKEVYRMAIPNESAADRFARDWASAEVDRVERGLLAQPEERKYRRYVDDATGDSAVEAHEA
jgi:hypothetical protein